MFLSGFSSRSSKASNHSTVWPKNSKANLSSGSDDYRSDYAKAIPSYNEYVTLKNSEDHILEQRAILPALARLTLNSQLLSSRKHHSYDFPSGCVREEESNCLFHAIPLFLKEQTCPDSFKFGPIFDESPFEQLPKGTKIELEQLVASAYRNDLSLFMPETFHADRTSSLDPMLLRSFAAAEMLVTPGLVVIEKSGEGINQTEISLLVRDPRFKNLNDFSDDAEKRLKFICENIVDWVDLAGSALKSPLMSLATVARACVLPFEFSSDSALSIHAKSEKSGDLRAIFGVSNSRLNLRWTDLDL